MSHQMNTSFQDKAAIVTGAGQGIGYEIAFQLAKRGTFVLLNDISEELANKAQENINAAFPGKCYALAGDASAYAFIQHMIQSCLTQFGRLDFAIANAGITLGGDFFSFPPDQLDKMLQLNLGGSFFLAQAAANHMREAGQGGRIIVMSSVVGISAYPQLTGYAITKAGLRMMARGLVPELSPYGITINAVAPGATLTERTLEHEHYQTEWEQVNPNRKVSTTLDIAEGVLFLLSDQAKHINGQTITIDGGWTGLSPNPESFKSI